MVQDLREKLKRLQEEFDSFKTKSANDFKAMQTQLIDKSKKELEAQKVKYEQMLDELRRNAAGDKEFVMNELKKKIAELEKQLEELRNQLAKERDDMMAQQKQLQAQHEQTVSEMRRDHQTNVQSLKDAHNTQIETLNQTNERKLEH